MRVVFFSGDEPVVEELVIGLRLRWPDLEPLAAARRDVGLRMIREQEPDLLFLCADLPGLNVWEAIREVRRFSDIPMILAQEAGSELDLVRAVELGADDLITVPCSPMIVTARVVALMRRTGMAGRPQNEDAITVGDLLIDPSSYEAFLGSERLSLTPTEFELLRFLVANRNLTVTQEMIQRELWAGSADAGATLKKYIQRLRRKLGDDARRPTWIHTVHGVGYRLTVPVATSV